MRIDAEFGADSGEWLVTVYLESESDLAASRSALEAAIRRSLRKRKILPSEVADFFCYRKDDHGQWVAIDRRPFRA